MPTNYAVRSVINTTYGTRPGISFIMTELLDFLITEDDNYLITDDSIYNSYGTRAVISSSYNIRTQI